MIAPTPRYTGGSRAPLPQTDFLALAGDFVQRYIWVATYVRGARVLESGSGFGAGALYLAQHGARSVLGLVSDRQAVEYAEQQYARSNLRFDVADAVDAALPSEAFDVVVSFGVLEHTSDPDAYLGSLRDALCPGGRLFLATTNPRFRERPGRSSAQGGTPILREYDSVGLTNLLSHFFEIQSLYGQTRLVSNEAMTADSAPPSSRRRASTALRRVVGKPLGPWRRNPRSTPGSPTSGGTWREYVIQDVRDPVAYVNRYPVQLVACVRRSQGIPEASNPSDFEAK